jgi:SAM-dependent methyltransferase
MVQGDLEALPVADGALNLVWCRDVLSCLGDAGRMLGEFARVLRPGGGMVLYAVFATAELPPGDRALLVEGLGNTAASMDRPRVEAAIAAAGFQVARRERIASEWSEHQLERDPGYLTQDLLEIARLTRDRARAEAVLGPVWYRRALGFASWRLQILLGRLMPGPVRPAPEISPGQCADTPFSQCGRRGLSDMLVSESSHAHSRRTRCTKCCRRCSPPTTSPSSTVRRPGSA